MGETRHRRALAIVAAAASLWITGGRARFAAADGAAEPPAAPSAGTPNAPVGTVLGAPLHRMVLADTIEIVARRSAPAALPPAPLLSPLPPAADRTYLRALAFSRATRPRTYERSRFARVVFGADRMAAAGAALGGLGLVSGLCGEKTAGYLMGGGAILGALWGGTVGADSPELRFGIETEPRTLELERRSERAGRERD
jgi:hypothetical protein